MIIFKILGRLNSEIHEISHQERIAVDENLTYH
jgi:hypothetical protein